MVPPCWGPLSDSAIQIVGTQASQAEQCRTRGGTGLSHLYSQLKNCSSKQKLKQTTAKANNVQDMTQQKIYDMDVVRGLALMTVVWGIVGMGVGVLIAAQLAWPALNFDMPWLTYGRLRPLHTNAVIFAFGGSALMCLAFYVVQRTCRTALISNTLAKCVFWGWNLVIVLAALGMATSSTLVMLNASRLLSAQSKQEV